MLFRQRIKPFTHIVELLSFMQDRTRRHGVRGFPREPKEGKLQMGCLVQGPERGEGGNHLNFILPRESLGMNIALRVRVDLVRESVQALDLHLH